MTFSKAVKTQAKLRLAIAGPSGSGKTYTALAISKTLANGGRVAMVDTEHGSASKYADLFDFDVMELEPPFHPDRFVRAVAEAAQAGYAVIILDSLTHAWSGTGGLLDEVDKIARQMRNPNSFAAWKDATPIQNRLVDAIIQAPIHIIATMRSKQEYVLSTDERGKQTPKKVGMTPQQRDGFEYEFDVFGEMDIDNTLLITKTRCPALTGGVYKRPGADVAAILNTWLQGAPAPERKPISAQPEPPAPGNGHGNPAADGWDALPGGGTQAQTPAPKPAKPAQPIAAAPKLKLPVIKCPDFPRFAKMFADDFTNYRAANGEPDAGHILGSIAKNVKIEDKPVDAITAANITDIFNALAEHALAKLAEAEMDDKAFLPVLDHEDK